MIVSRLASNVAAAPAGAVWDAPVRFIFIFQHGPRCPGSSPPRTTRRALDNSGPFWKHFHLEKGKGTKRKATPMALRPAGTQLQRWLLSNHRCRGKATLS